MMILEDAFAIQDAGASCWNSKRCQREIAKVISAQLDIPRSASEQVWTDGQILLSYDLLGAFVDFKPSSPAICNLAEVAVNGLRQYVAEVKSGRFRTTSTVIQSMTRVREFLSLVKTAADFRAARGRGVGRSHARLRRTVRRRSR